MKTVNPVTRKIMDHAAFRLSRFGLHRYFRLEEDSRESLPYRLVFFTGSNGLEYLNAALVSVHRSWNQLPNIVILVSDDTSEEIIRKTLVKWPRGMEVISWKTCAQYYIHTGFPDLARYAEEKRWPGRKFVGLSMLAEQEPILYCDTDVLWYHQPSIPEAGRKPCLILGPDIVQCYTPFLLSEMQLEQEMQLYSLNSGVMFMHGDFKSYPRYAELIHAELKNPDRDNFAEQTAFAILSQYFNPGQTWRKEDILIKVDDRYRIEYTEKRFPFIKARHYVNNKDLTFWRDFAFMFFNKTKRMRALK